MDYKVSLYTARVVLDSKVYLYNTFSDQLLVLSQQINKIWIDNVNNLQKIKDIHPDFFSALVDGGFIVELQKNEVKAVRNFWRSEDQDPRKYTIIINSTLNCNLRCWYCYEKHDKSAYMSLEVINSICELIKRKTSDPQLIGLNIDFFGGEPFMNYKKCILPILDYAYEKCTTNNKQLFVSFTTNGYLLNEEVLLQLKKFARWGSLRFQITLDGNKELHDQTRKKLNGEGTYEKIISNICKCAQLGYKVLVRLNYTERNITSFYDVIDDFSALSTACKRNLSFSFHKVWQESGSEYLEQAVNEVKSSFIENELFVERIYLLSHSRCYGDKENTVVINYNGDLYKCTARDFSPFEREGVLTEKGQINWNGKYEQRMFLKYGPKTCEQCKIFPLCHAGCSQNKLENIESHKCAKGYSQQKIEDLLREHVGHLLECDI